MNEPQRILAWLQERTDGSVELTGQVESFLVAGSQPFAYRFIENGDGFRFDGWACWTNKGRVASAETLEDMTEIYVLDQGA